MSNWVTSVACIIFPLLFIVAAFLMGRDWIRMVIGQVRFGRYMYDGFKGEKREWERRRAAQGEAALQGEGTNGSSAESSAPSPDKSAHGRR